MTFDLLQIYPLLKLNQFKQFLHCISKKINTVHVFLKISKCVRFERLTFKKRTYFLPACYASLFGVLPHRGLQEEEGDTTGEQEQHIRNEEHTLEKQTSGRSCLNVQCKASIKTKSQIQWWWNPANCTKFKSQTIISGTTCSRRKTIKKIVLRLF